MKKKIPSSIKTEIFPIDIFKHGVRVVVGSEEDLLSVAECEGWRDEAVKAIDGVDNYLAFTRAVTAVVCTSEIAFLFHNFKNTFKFCGNITVHKIRRLKLTELKYRHLL